MRIINLPDLLLLCLFIIGLSSILLLSIGIFSPLMPVFMGLIISFLIIIIFNYKLVINLNFFNPWLLLILTLALVFRYNPNLYVVGGQDEGLYVTMSHIYESQGGLNFTDHLGTRLSDSDRQIYDSGGGAVVPGIDRNKDINNSYTIPFYPLHPAFMAIFSQLFGSSYRVYSLTFFSLLSIFSIYSLTKAISKNELAGLIAALLFALNPLLIFLSKFPVSETVAITFIILSFYYLVSFHKQIQLRPLYLVLSLLSINCFFYTRMSGILLMPFYVLILLLSIIEKNKLKRRYLLIYISSVLLSFVLSYVFYYRFIYSLFVPTFESIVVNIFGSFWYIWILLLILIIYLTYSLLIYSKQYNLLYQKILLKLFKYKVFITVLLLAIIVMLNSINYYKLFFIPPPGNACSSMLVCLNGPASYGWQSIGYLLLYSLMLYVSPLGLLILFYNSIKTKNVNVYLFLTSILCYLLIIYSSWYIKYVPYSFYYVRYLSSEILPLSLVIIAIFLARSYYKKLLIPIILGYFLYFSLLLIGKNEGPSINAINNITSIFSQNDIILFDNSLSPQKGLYDIVEIRTAMHYYYDYNTLSTTSVSEICESDYKSILNNFDKIYYVSSVASDGINLKLVYSDKYIYNYFSNGSNHFKSYLPYITVDSMKFPFPRFAIPSIYNQSILDIYIYQVDVSGCEMIKS